MNKAVFFDRDNTLIIDKNYMHKVEDLKFFPDTFSALKIIQDKDFKLFIVTNQSGIGRGFFTEKDMHIFHQELLSQFSQNHINIEEIVFCPHSPEDHCDCRKPSPKLINQLIDKYEIDSSISYMIGDKLIDAEAGKNANCNGVLIYKQSEEFQSFSTLTDFANFL